MIDFGWHFAEICSQWFYQQLANIGLDNGLVLNGRQAIV